LKTSTNRPQCIISPSTLHPLPPSLSSRIRCDYLREMSLESCKRPKK
jgi:hypothetical protein